MRKHLSQDQKNFIADKLMDTANYAVAILGLGQLVQKEVNVLALLLGVLLYLWLWILSIQLRGGERR